jgi:hypothetical protein
MRCERGSEADETGSDSSPPVTGPAETRYDAATTRRLGMTGGGRGTQGRSDDDPNTSRGSAVIGICWTERQMGSVTVWKIAMWRCMEWVECTALFLRHEVDGP